MIYRLKEKFCLASQLAILCACASTPSRAGDRQTPKWKWTGFEIMGEHKVSRDEIIAQIPLTLGSEYRENPKAWASWCEGLKAKFSLPFTHCSATRYPDYSTYLIVEIVEPGYEYRNSFRSIFGPSLPLATPQILELYDRLYARQMALFNDGKQPGETTDLGFLDFEDAEMHSIALRLTKLVPPFRSGILRVLENDPDTEKREKAANLLNWTREDLDSTAVMANALLDDPSSAVRNNISRFTMHFVSQLRLPRERRLAIDHLLMQLDRPSFGDRNKAIFNLFLIAQQFPDTRLYMKAKGISMIQYIAANSVVSNVGGTASDLLRMLQAPEISK